MSIEDTNAFDPITGKTPTAGGEPTISKTGIAGRDRVLDLEKELVDPMTSKTGIAGRDRVLDLEKELVDPMTSESLIAANHTGF